MFRILSSLRGPDLTQKALDEFDVNYEKFVGRAMHGTSRLLGLKKVKHLFEGNNSSTFGVDVNALRTQERIAVQPLKPVEIALVDKLKQAQEKVEFEIAVVQKIELLENLGVVSFSDGSKLESIDNIMTAYQQPGETLVSLLVQELQVHITDGFQNKHGDIAPNILSADSSPEMAKVIQQLTEAAKEIQALESLDFATRLRS